MKHSSYIHSFLKKHLLFFSIVVALSFYIFSGHTTFFNQAQAAGQINDACGGDNVHHCVANCNGNTSGGGVCTPYVCCADSVAKGGTTTTNTNGFTCTTNNTCSAKKCTVGTSNCFGSMTSCNNWITQHSGACNGPATTTTSNNGFSCSGNSCAAKPCNIGTNNCFGTMSSCNTWITQHSGSCNGALTTSNGVAKAGDKCGPGGVDTCITSNNGYPAGACSGAGAGVCGKGLAKLYCCAGPRTAQPGDKCGTNGVDTCVTSTSGYNSCNATQGAGVCGNGTAKLYCCAGKSTTTGGGVVPAPITTGGNNTPAPAPGGYLCQCNDSDHFFCTPTGSFTGFTTITNSCSTLAANSQGAIPANAVCGLAGVTQVTSANSAAIAATMCTATNASNTACTSGATGGSTQQCTNVCNGISAGSYCGGTVGGNTNYLYVCDGKNNGPTGLTKCSTCQVNTPGTPDCCAGTSCNTSQAVGNITATIPGTTTVLLASKVLAAQAIVLTDNLNYVSATNTFSNPSFRITNLPAGSYNLFLHVNGYLDKQLTNNANNIFTITAGQAVMNVGPVALIPGDIAPQPKGDNSIDIQDYNAVIGCLGTQAVTATCVNKAAADINHDGIIDLRDLSTVQTAFSQKGDSITVGTPSENPGNDVNPGAGNGTPNPTSIPTFTCVTDPSCATKNTNSMQLCPLKCTQK